MCVCVCVEREREREREGKQCDTVDCTGLCVESAQWRDLVKEGDKPV